MPASKQTQNLSAFLDMLAYSEQGAELLAISANGYNVLVGSTAKNPKLFKSYVDHPRILVKINDNLSSTAAGRYQLLARYFNPYKKLLNLLDFSPVSQDAIAIQQIKERNALDLIEKGNIVQAIKLCSNIWASLPGAGYNQHEHTIENLIPIYTKYGGKLASTLKDTKL